MKRKVMCLLLGLLLLLSGCAEAPIETPSTDTGTGSYTESGERVESDSAALPETAEQICLVKDGIAQYTVVWDSSMAVSAAELLIKGLKEQTGVAFPRFAAEDGRFKKIYVGCEYSDVMSGESSTLLGTYGVVAKDGDLYFYFDTEVAAAICVTDFLALLTTDVVRTDDNGKTQVLLAEEQLFWCPAEPNPYAGSFLGVSFGEYRIVISADAIEAEQYYATQLAKKMSEFTKQTVAVVTDDTEPVELEIVIGNTTREGSADFYEGDPAPYSFAIKSKGNDLYIGYSNVYCLPYATDRFGDVMRTDTDSVDILDTDSAYRYTVEREQDTDVRVMTSNVLFCNHPAPLSKEDTIEYKARMQLTAGYYGLHMPDFIGLQECFYMMRQALNPCLPQEYEYVMFEDFNVSESNGKNFDYFPVLYHAGKWKVEACGVFDPDAGGAPWGYVWVTFSRLDDPSDQYTLVNLHYSFLEGNTLRLPVAEQLNAFLKEELQRNPNTPIAVTGDYNGNVNSDVFQTQVAGIAMRTAQSLAGTGNASTSIDHICVTYETVDVIRYRVNTDANASFMSDHQAHFADLRKKAASNT